MRLESYEMESGRRSKSRGSPESGAHSAKGNEECRPSEAFNHPGGVVTDGAREREVAAVR